MPLYERAPKSTTGVEPVPIKYASDSAIRRIGDPPISSISTSFGERALPPRADAALFAEDISEYPYIITAQLFL